MLSQLTVWSPSNAPPKSQKWPRRRSLFLTPKSRNRLPTLCLALVEQSKAKITKLPRAYSSTSPTAALAFKILIVKSGISSKFAVSIWPSLQRWKPWREKKIYRVKASLSPALLKRDLSMCFGTTSFRGSSSVTKRIRVASTKVYSSIWVNSTRSSSTTKTTKINTPSSQCSKYTTLVSWWWLFWLRFSFL